MTKVIRRGVDEFSMELCDIDIRNASALVCVEIWGSLSELDANKIWPDLKRNNP